MALYALLVFSCAPAQAQQTLAAPVASIDFPTPVLPPPCATEPATEQQAQAWPWYADTVYLARYYDSLRPPILSYPLAA